MEFSWGTNLISIPFGLFIFCFHFFSNYLKKLINYLLIFYFIKLINRETSYRAEKLEIFLKELFELRDSNNDKE